MTLASQSVIASEIELDGVKCTVHFSILVPDKSDDSACAKRKGIMRFRKLSRETVTFLTVSLPNASASAGSAPCGSEPRSRNSHFPYRFAPKRVCQRGLRALRFRNLSRETVTFPIGSLPNALNSAVAAPVPTYFILSMSFMPFAAGKGILRFRNLARETVTSPIGSLPNASASAGSAQKRGESLEKTRLKNNKDVGFMMVLLYHACTKKSMVLYNFQLFI